MPSGKRSRSMKNSSNSESLFGFDFLRFLAIADEPKTIPRVVAVLTTVIALIVALATWQLLFEYPGVFGGEIVRRCTAVLAAMRHVALQSTGVFWIPLYDVLEERGFEVYLVNARPSTSECGHRPPNPFRSTGPRCVIAGIVYTNPRDTCYCRA
jgi:hypothetical protein